MHLPLNLTGSTLYIEVPHSQNMPVGGGILHHWFTLNSLDNERVCLIHTSTSSFFCRVDDEISVFSDIPILIMKLHAALGIFPKSLESEDRYSTHQLNVIGKSKSVITGVVDVKLQDLEPGMQHGEAGGVVTS